MEGKIVLVQFPQDSKGKTRPAMVLRSFPRYGDLLLCGITSKPHQYIEGFDLLLDQTHPDFIQSGLKHTGICRLNLLTMMPEHEVIGKTRRSKRCYKTQIAQKPNRLLTQFKSINTYVKTLMQLNKILSGVLVLLSLSMSSCMMFGPRSAPKEVDPKAILKEALAYPTDTIAIPAITSSASFIHAVEPVLFHIYGEDEVSAERPYRVYHFDRYWLVIGTLEDRTRSGDFKLVADATQNRIIYISHAK